ncbi:MAG: peptidyl-prolyl cis-trans isomerase [Verrucomicrobia bacterium]|nr:peptidyl-prolyl cis-trans isomerase [Verrucomicrobiota bacterium]
MSLLKAIAFWSAPAERSGDGAVPRSAQPALLAKALLTACAALLALTLVSCSKTNPPVVLATVGERQITADDFQREVERRHRARQPVADKEALLQEMVAFEAQVQNARRAGLADDPQVQREIGLMLIGKWRERELAPRVDAVQITPEEVRAEYERELAKYTRPAKVRVAMLFLQADPKASETRRAELRQRLEEARQKIAANPSPGGRGPAATGFGPLALDFSDDQASRHRGGDLGWLDAGRFDYHWPKPVLEAAYALDKGQTSAVLEAEGGFYVVMKTDAREAAVTPFEQVQATLRHTLLLKKKRELEEAFRREAVRLAGAEIHHQALAGVELPPSAHPVAQRQSAEPPGLPGTNESNP